MTVKCSIHTHTTFCDGKDTAEDMVISAIQCGCNCIGFSGHSYIDYPNSLDWTMSPEIQKKYVQEIGRLKEKYNGKIDILLGIEQDYFSEPLVDTYDYIIGSVHATEKCGVRLDVDATPQILSNGIEELYHGDVMELIRDYYALVSNVVEKTKCDIIGHFDVITKFNNKYPFVDTCSKEYREIAFDALDCLIKKDKIFEINTGAISRGWRDLPYPEDFLLRRIAQKNANVIITSDAHSKQTITFGFDNAIEYAKFCGIKEICVFENREIKKITI